MRIFYYIFFKSIKRVSLKSVEKVLSWDHCPMALNALLSQIKDTKDNAYIKVRPMLEGAVISEEDIYKFGISENVNDLLQASVYFKEKKW